MGFHVLMYHEFRKKGEFDPETASPSSAAQDYKDALPPVLFSYLDDFEEQMAYLKAEGYHTLTLQEVRDYYEKDAAIPEKSVLLTFDDAFQSLHRYAYPILKKHQFQATCFVVLGWLYPEKMSFDPSRSIVMSKSELEEMRDVFELGNHTANFHRRYPDGTADIQRASLEELKEDLEQCGNYVDHADIFAYPFGIYDSKVVERLSELGIQYAFTTESGENTRQTNRLELYRHTAALGYKAKDLKQLLEKTSLI